jgi:4-hydroxy-tetrahydrodipicolinate synthase
MTRRRLPLPAGVGVALVTIFDDDSRVDAEATAERAVACVEAGVTSVLLAGTTGEAHRLDAADRLTLAEACRIRLPDTPLLVGTGDPSAERALQLTASVAEGETADALVVLCPGDTPAGDFYRAARQVAADTPLLAYHFPAVSPPGIDAGEVASLPVDGIKDSSGDAERLAVLLEDRVTVYVGSPTLLSLAGPCGAAGALLALANTVPSVCREAFSGDATAQRRLFFEHRQSLADFPASLKGPLRVPAGPAVPG